MIPYAATVLAARAGRGRARRAGHDRQGDRRAGRGQRGVLRGARLARRPGPGRPDARGSRGPDPGRGRAGVRREPGRHDVPPGVVQPRGRVRRRRWRTGWPPRWPPAGSTRPACPPGPGTTPGCWPPGCPPRCCSSATPPGCPTHRRSTPRTRTARPGSPRSRPCCATWPADDRAEPAAVADGARGVPAGGRRAAVPAGWRPAGGPGSAAGTPSWPGWAGARSGPGC